MPIEFSPTMMTFREVKKPVSILKNVDSTDSSWILQIDKISLPIYQQAADLQGVDLKVLGQEGEIFKNDSKVSPGNVGISLNREKTEGGLHDFWETIKLIEAELPNVRIG